MDAAASKTKALCVATRCTTVQQFVETFQRFCDETSFFVATLTMRPVGLETPFAIQLADRTPVLRGICVVLDAWSTADNKYKRPGIRLGIKRLTPDSTDTYAKLREASIAAELGRAAPPEFDTPDPDVDTADPMAMHTAITREGLNAAELRKQQEQGRATPAPRATQVTPPRASTVVSPTGQPPPMPPTKRALATPPPMRAIDPTTLPPARAVVPAIPPTSPAPPPATPTSTPGKSIPRIVSTSPEAETWIKNVPARPKTEPSPVGPKAIERSGAVRSSRDTHRDEPKAAAPAEKVVVANTAPAPALPTRQIPPKTTPANGVPVVAPEPKPGSRRHQHARISPLPPSSGTPSSGAPVAIKHEPTSAMPALLRPPASAPTPPAPHVTPSMPLPIRPPNGANGTNGPNGMNGASGHAPAVGPNGQPTHFAISVVAAMPPPASPLDLSAVVAPNPVGEIPPAGADGRVPGSELVLPANPLMHLTDESIGGFVDCTLYEDGSNFLRPDEQEWVDDDLGGGTFGRRRGASLPPSVGMRPTTIPPPLSTDPPVALMPVDAYGRPTTIPPWLAMAPPTQQPPLPVVTRTGNTIPPAMSTRTGNTIPPPPVAPQSVPIFVPPAVPVPEPVTDESSYRTGSLAAIPRRGRTPSRLIALVALPAAAVLIGVVVVATRGKDPVADAKPTKPAKALHAVDTGSATPPVESPQPAVVDPPAPPKTPPKPVEVAQPDESKQPDEPDDNPDGDGELPVVGEGPCLLNVTSTPAGSNVIVDGRPMGPSPLVVAGPCTRRKVDVAHPRYKMATTWVSLVADKPGNVDLRLTRPTHTLNITTFPIGATISIGGRRAGTSPSIVQVMGFSNVTIKVEKPGFKPVSQKVYTKDPKGKVFVRLTR